MKTYNKLVRDKIPEIIQKAGKECNIRVLEDNEYIYYLNKKLEEEFEEYLESQEIMELADVVEVIYAILDARGVGIEEFEKIRKTKRDSRGGFNERLFLIDVSE